MATIPALAISIILIIAHYDVIEGSRLVLAAKGIFEELDNNANIDGNNQQLRQMPQFQSRPSLIQMGAEEMVKTTTNFAPTISTTIKKNKKKKAIKRKVSSLNRG